MDVSLDARLAMVDGKLVLRTVRELEAGAVAKELFGAYYARELEGVPASKIRELHKRLTARKKEPVAPERLQNFDMDVLTAVRSMKAAYKTGLVAKAKKMKAPPRVDLAAEARRADEMRAEAVASVSAAREDIAGERRRQQEAQKAIEAREARCRALEADLAARQRCLEASEATAKALDGLKELVVSLEARLMGAQVLPGARVLPGQAPPAPVLPDR